MMQEKERLMVSIGYFCRRERDENQFTHGRDRKGQVCGSHTGRFPGWVVEE